MDKQINCYTKYFLMMIDRNEILFIMKLTADHNRIFRMTI